MLRNNKVNMVLSLLIAFALWVYVLGVDNPPRDVPFRSIPIIVLNQTALAEDGLVLSSISQEELDVTVTMPRSEVGNVVKKDLRATVDLASLSAGEHQVEVKVANPDPNQFTLAPSIKYVTVVIEERISEDKPVRVVLSGPTDDDNEPYIMQVDKSEVQVTGARSLVESIAEVRASLDVARVETQLRAFNCELTPVNANGVAVEDVRISPSSVSVSAVLLQKKTVPLEVPINDDGVVGQANRTVSVPQTITVKGADVDLQRIRTIWTEPINLAEVYEDTTIELTPILPNRVELADNSLTLEAKVKVTGLVKREFTYGKEAVIIEGLTEDLMATVSDAKLKLTVIAQEEEDETLQEGAFYFIADVSGLAEGEYTVPLTCYHELNLVATHIEPESVTVTIQRRPEESMDDVPQVQEPEAGGDETGDGEASGGGSDETEPPDTADEVESAP